MTRSITLSVRGLLLQKGAKKKGVELAVKVRLGFRFVFVWSRRAKGQRVCMLVRAPHIQPLQKQAARGEGAHSWKRRSAKAARLSRGREQGSRAQGEGRGGRGARDVLAAALD